MNRKISILLLVAVCASSCEDKPDDDSQRNTGTMTVTGSGVTISLSGTGAVTIDWGDGSRETHTFSDDSSIEYFRHDYSVNSAHTIIIKAENITLLDCSGNQLTNLDVSKNSTLTSLCCDDNRLTNLDVSINTALTKLSCVSNQLTNLDVSQNINLNRLDCSSNQLSEDALNSLFRTLQGNSPGTIYIESNPGTDLCDRSIASDKGWVVWNDDAQKITMTTATSDQPSFYILMAGTGAVTFDWGDGSRETRTFSGDSSIEYFQHYYSDNSARTITIKAKSITLLDCSGKQLTNLDVSKNSTLTSLSCDDNRLTNLDVSINTALTKLSCGSNQLTNLDLSNNNALTLLNCENNQLINLAVNNNPELTWLNCDDNFLTNLDVSINIKLNRLDCNSNQLSEETLNSLFRTLQRTSPGTIYIGSNPGTDLCNRSIASDKGWVVWNDDAQKITMTTATADQSIFYILMAGSGKITIDWGDGSEIETYLLSEYAHSFGRRQGGLVEAYRFAHIYSVKSSTITITGKNLTHLYCRNELTGLDVSKNAALVYLDCSYNLLKSLDVSKNTALTYLDCVINELTSLDVSKNTALRELHCGQNPLTGLDVSKNTALEKLCCCCFPLTSLDVSKNTALTILECGENDLTSLDVSKNTALKKLACYPNKLTSLDVSKNTALEVLYCGSNLLDANALNSLFGTLHSNAGDKNIEITNNPGANDCDQSIATDKGWKVFR